MCEKATKYAGEVDAPMRRDAHITITDMLRPILPEDDEPFSHVFSRYSIFRFSYKKAGDAEGIDANLPIDEWQDFKEGAQAAGMAVMAALNHRAAVPEESQDADSPVADGFQGSIAFTTCLTMGKLKGNSPGDLLLGASEPEKMAAELENHKRFLEDKVARYPNNQAAIDAIDEALNLYELELLSDSRPKAAPLPEKRLASAPAGGELIVYQSGIKYFKKKNAAGMNKCYEFSIFCCPERKFPYRMEFRNYYAPIRDNMIVLREKDSSSEKTATFNMSRSEFNAMHFRMQTTVDTFIAVHGGHMRMEDESRRWKPAQGVQA